MELKMEILLKYFTEFTPKQIEQFAALKNVYTEWNEKINVISRKDIDSLYEKHVLHSLAIAALFQFKPGTLIVDLGTGGGFPGVPLAIFFPEVRFHLTDSIGKKLKVVEAVATELGLKNITTQHIRTEEIENQKFDYVMSRAVAPLKDLWRWSQPILKARGQGQSVQCGEETYYGGLICLKGGNLDEEIKESSLHPLIWEINELFTDEYFKEKFVLMVRR